MQSQEAQSSSRQRIAEGGWLCATLLSALLQAACTPSGGSAQPPDKAVVSRADGADIVLTGVALDRLVDGKVAAYGTAAEVSYVRASGRFEARDLRARMRATGRGELQVAAPDASGAADPRQGPLVLRGGVTGAATPEPAPGLLATGPVPKAGSGGSKGSSKAAKKPTPAGALTGPEPIRYAADVFRTDPKEHLVHLDGRVKLTRGDLLVTGDRSVAELAPDGAAKTAAPGLGLFKTFTVDGAVHVERGGRTADGEHAVYDSEAQTLTLSGPARAQPGEAALPGPVLRDGQERLTGQSVVLLLDRDEVRVVQPRLVLHRSQLAGGKKPPAKDGAGAADKPVQPVEINAQALLIDQERRVLHFSGDVLLRKGDLTVRGPKLDARYEGSAEGSGKSSNTEIDQAEVMGGVVLRQGARRATGRTASYSATSGKVVLLGDPRLFDRGDELRGDRIELSVDTEEVRVEKARGRLHPSAHQGEAPVQSAPQSTKSAEANPGARPAEAKP